MPAKVSGSAGQSMHPLGSRHLRRRRHAKLPLPTCTSTWLEAILIHAVLRSVCAKRGHRHSMMYGPLYGDGVCAGAGPDGTSRVHMSKIKTSTGLPLALREANKKRASRNGPRVFIFRAPPSVNHVCGMFSHRTLIGHQDARTLLYYIRSSVESSPGSCRSVGSRSPVPYA